MATAMKPRRKRPAANYTLSKTARRMAQLLQKPLDKTSESAVVEVLILREAARLGLRKPETVTAGTIQPQPEQVAA